MIDDVLDRAGAARREAPAVGDDRYAGFTGAAGRAVHRRWPEIAEANEADLRACRDDGLPEHLLDRMRLDEGDRDALVAACAAIAAELPPGPELDRHETADGRTVRRVRRPLGVILMIFEARAGIAVRNAVLAAAVGNAVLLRGAKEITRTNRAVVTVLGDALEEAGLPAGLVSFVDGSSRSELRELLGRDDALDVVVPRGSPGLITMCRRNSAVPLILSGAGVNHLYVDAGADPAVAAEVTIEGKLHDPVACTALESVLVHADAFAPYLDALADRVDATGAEPRLRLPEELAGSLPDTLRALLDAEPLADVDDGREYLDPTLAIRTVAGLAAAAEHIAAFGSAHTEGVVASDPAVVDEFTRTVDAATIVVNGPMRLHDGPALGLGPAVALSTGRLHARGPVTVHDLQTHTWVIEGHAVPA